MKKEEFFSLVKPVIIYESFFAFLIENYVAVINTEEGKFTAISENGNIVFEISIKDEKFFKLDFEIFKKAIKEFSPDLFDEAKNDSFIISWNFKRSYAYLISFLGETHGIKNKEISFFNEIQANTMLDEELQKLRSNLIDKIFNKKITISSGIEVEYYYYGKPLLYIELKRDEKENIRQSMHRHAKPYR